MFRIKRTKALPPPALGAPSILYATGAAARGSISGWTRNEEQAAVFDTETVARIKAFHADRKHVGTLTPEPVQEMPTIVVDPKSSDGAEFAELLAEHQKLRAQSAERDRYHRAAMEEASKDVRKLQDATDKVVEMEEQLSARSKQAEGLTARVAELEAALAEAQAPAPAAPEPPESRGSRRNPK